MTNKKILTNFIRKRVLYGTGFDDRDKPMVYECQICHDVLGLFTKQDALEHYKDQHVEPKSIAESSEIT